MEIGPFSGMNNRAADHALPQGSSEGPRAAVRNAVSVDFDNAGKATRRQGITKKCACVNLRYGFGCSQGSFIVEGSDLKKVAIDWTKTVIATGVRGTTFAHHEFNNALYFSDGIKGIKIIAGAAENWGMVNPPPPVIYGNAGVFGAGKYLACLTYVDALGNESGASDIAEFAAVASSSFVFTNLPSAQDVKVVATRLYLTTANGDVFFQCGEVVRGTASYSVILPYDGGKTIDTMFMAKPPAGQIIREFNGRMMVARGPVIYISEPYSPDLFSQLSKDYFQFSHDVTVMEPVDDGVWIVADKTYFWPGSGPIDFQDHAKLEYGAAFGTGKKMPDNSGNVTWFSKRGLIMAGNGGEIKNVQEAQVAPDMATVGAMLIRESNGIKQAITSLKNPTLSPMAARSFIDMEVIRRAT